jgi:NTE family protein
MGVRPHRIAGTSIGAIMGALYASGVSGTRIREGVQRMIVSKGDSFRDMLKKRDALRWFEFLDVSFKSSGIFKGDKFIDFLFSQMSAHTFEDQHIPLSVVAADFWKSEQVVLESGDLLSAVKASMGLPGVFTPVHRDGRILIDGGGVNPVPHDILDDCDITIAIDVLGDLQPTAPDQTPNLVRTVLATFDIMQNSIVKAKRKLTPPDIYIRPAITDVDILDFYKAETVYEQVKQDRLEFIKELKKLLT